MRTKLQLLMLFLFVSGILWAGHVPSEKARLAAKNFYFEHLQDNSKKYKDITFSDEFSISYSGSTVLHVFNVEGNNGWLVVSADDQVFPVLSYSFTGHFIMNDPNMPPAFAFWIEGYKKQIKNAIDKNYTNTSAVSAWESYTNNFKGAKDIQAVTPLLDPIAWNQTQYYNDRCPVTDSSGAGYGGHCPTGCVATATAQIMKFWGYPAKGQGTHSYTHATYGNQTANFAATTYNWANMPNSVTAANADVAQLMYHVGVSVNMNYAPGVSGASTTTAMSSLVTYFKYASDIKYKAKTDTTPNGWKALIKSNLDAHKPILYSGMDPAVGGHAFVLDGYQDTAHYHFNWGWGGSYNSYNSLSAVQPGGVGTGGGNGDYTADQDMIYNIHPAADYYPTADFNGIPTTVVVGSSVQFTDLSTAPTGTTISHRYWYFDNGTPTPDTSTVTNPVHAYNATGTYDVSLRVTSNQGSDSIAKVNYITVVPPSTMAPNADFVADYQNRMVGQSVNFTDLSGGTPLFWSWKFQGGTPATSTIQNPASIVYSTAGNYKVTLTITNTIGTDSLVRLAYIHIVSSTPVAPIAEFSGNPRLITVGQSVNYSDSSLNTPLQWAWTFTGGTPSTSTLQNPTGIVYGTAGLYPVTLTVNNNTPNTTGTNTKTKADYILVTTSQLPEYCDTLSNILASDWASLHMYNVPTGGYVAGPNSKGIKAYAEKFTNYTYSDVSAIMFSVGKSKTSSIKKVRFSVWGGTAGGPSVSATGSTLAPLGYKDVNISQMPANVYKYITFDSPIHIPSNGIFYVGFEVVSVDTFVLNVANRGVNGNNTLYVKNSAGVWQTCKASSIGIAASMDIQPISCLVDVQKLEADDNISIFPNPANNYIIVDFGDINVTNARINIFDLMGKEVKVYQPQLAGNQLNVGTSELKNGLYLLNIQCDGKTYTKRISIMK